MYNVPVYAAGRASGMYPSTPCGQPHTWLANRPYRAVTPHHPVIFAKTAQVRQFVFALVALPGAFIFALVALWAQFIFALVAEFACKSL